MPISTTYTVKSTQGTLPGNLNLTIQVGTASGPSELSQLADLTFYGYGRASWGQEVDQNFYRLLENFACEGIGSPPSPKNKIQLGGTLGINKPIKGQSWFNLNNTELYICANVPNDYPTTPATWRHIISEPFANTTYLKISDASGTGPNAFLKLDGSNSPMTGQLVLSGLPTIDNHAATKVYVDDAISAATGSTGSLYITKAGDTGIGILTLQDGIIGPYTTLRRGSLEIGRADGTVGTPYFDFHSNGSPITDFDCRIISSGGTAGTPGEGTLTIHGFVTLVKAPTLPNQATTKSYVDTAIVNAINTFSTTANGAYVKKIGDTMTGILNMNNHRVTNVGTPVSGTDAANATWTRSVFYGNSSSGAVNNIFISTANPSGGNAGDIWLQY